MTRHPEMLVNWCGKLIFSRLRDLKLHAAQNILWLIDKVRSTAASKQEAKVGSLKRRVRAYAMRVENTLVCKPNMHSCIRAVRVRHSGRIKCDAVVMAGSPRH